MRKKSISTGKAGTKIINPLPAKLVLVEWVDSAGTNGWTFLEGARWEPVHCFTVGWLIYESSSIITVAPHLSDPEAMVDLQASGVMTIPKVAIVKRKVIG